MKKINLAARRRLSSPTHFGDRNWAPTLAPSAGLFAWMDNLR
jgi:hypothetical protein